MHTNQLIASFAVAAFASLELGCAPSVGKGRPAWIDGFSGWAGPGGGVLYARVHKGKPIAKPKPKESSWKRLEETVDALELDAFEHATVTVSGVDGVTSATANDHGFIALVLPADLFPGPLRVTLTMAERGWQSATAEIVVQVWDDQPGLGVISDIDDTLTDTGVTHKAKLVKNTFFLSEYELKIFAGAPQVLSMMAGNDHPGGARLAGRALFYLSGSP
jgi:phosphatidate phosphatase APP1